MNRTIKDAAVKRYHYADHDELRRFLPLFFEAKKTQSPAQKPPQPHNLRIYLLDLDERAQTLQTRPVTPHAENKILRR